MLSVVVATRNDNHGGDMVGRTNMFIHGLNQQAIKYNVPIELIVVEWNPPSWSRPIADVLEWPACSTNWRVRVITVPPEIHKNFENSEKLEFFQMIAKNVGIRRASYPWVLATNPDLLYSNELFKNLAEGLPREDLFYRALRYDVETGQIPSGDLEEQLKYCQENASDVQGQPISGIHTYACGDFTLMHKDAWYDMRGYPEFHIWSIHIDSMLLFLAANAGYEECLITGEIFHIKHARSWIANPELAKEYPHFELPQATSITSLMGVKGASSFRINTESWGLVDADLETVQVC